MPRRPYLRQIAVPARAGSVPNLAEQMRIHPSMTPRDIAKLCYQAARGAEHLLTDLD